jgi:hypothetical protein
MSTVKRPAGVTLAAIVLALMSACGLLIAAASMAVFFLTRHPIVPNIPAVRITVICLDLLMLLLLLWSIWTVVGLFQLKPWARYSILALGALDLFFFGVQSVGLLMLRSRPDLPIMVPVGSNGIHITSVLLDAAIFDALIALIGFSWLVYFSLSRVRLAFSGEARAV